MGFFLAGRRPADAGLLGVLGAAVSGPGLHPIRTAADAACSYASPKQRFTLRDKTLIAPPPSHPLMRTDAQNASTTAIIYSIFRLGSHRLWFLFLFVCHQAIKKSGVHEGYHEERIGGSPGLNKKRRSTKSS